MPKWNQASAPTKLQAVFGPDKPVAAAPPGGSEDRKYADLQLTDPNGYTVNTANHGAGDWQLDATDYDANDSVIRTLDLSSRSGVLLARSAAYVAPVGPGLVDMATGPRASGRRHEYWHGDLERGGVPVFEELDVTSSVSGCLAGQPQPEAAGRARVAATDPGVE